MYRQFNPNPAGKYVDDCVIRALCYALSESWDRIFFELSMQAFIAKDLPNANSVWGTVLYIKEIGLDGLQTKPVKVIKCEEVTEADLTEKKEQPQYITKDMLEDFLATYLDEHQYKLYIPKKKNPS